MLELWIEGTIEQAAEVANSGAAAAIATNPRIMAQWTQDGRSLEAVAADICARTHVPVYIQLHGPDVDSYQREMERLLQISDQIHPKLVATHAGVSAVRAMKQMGRRSLVTTVASLNQAYLAAAAGADYVAPYVGRIEDAGRDAMQLIADIAAMYARSGATTQIAAASIRSPQQAEAALRAGTHLLVMGYPIYQDLLADDLTQNWIDRFEEDWRTFRFMEGQQTGAQR